MDKTFKVEGMRCGHCKMLVEMAVSELPGVASATADNAAGSLRVDFDPAVCSEDAIKAAVAQEGFSVVD